MPSIDAVYGEPVIYPDEIVTESFAGEPSADQILDKYLLALGGADRLAKVTSFIATGTSEGFRGRRRGSGADLCKAPDQRATIIKFAANVGRPDAIRVFDGRNGWVSAPLSVVPEYALGGSELDGARVDAQLSFPAQIKKALTQLRVGSPDNVNGRDVHVVQETGRADWSPRCISTARRAFSCGWFVLAPRLSGAHQRRWTSPTIATVGSGYQDAVPLDVRLAQRSRQFRVERSASMFRLMRRCLRPRSSRTRTGSARPRICGSAGLRCTVAQDFSPAISERKRSATWPVRSFSPRLSR